MKLVAEAGTDAAAVVLFDPVALPDDFDERYKKHPLEVAEELRMRGQFFYQDTGADGGYLLHLYVDEPVPEELAQYAVESVEMDVFQVPGGRLWFTGAEYAFRDDVTEYQGMGSVLEIPKGTYQVHIIETEYPEEYVEDMVKNSLTPEEQRISRENENLPCGGCLASVLTALALWFWSFAFPSLLLIPALIACWFYISRRFRSPVYLAAEEKKQAVERNYPSYIAEFRSLSIQ